MNLFDKISYPAIATILYFSLYFIGSFLVLGALLKWALVRFKKMSERTDTDLDNNLYGFANRSIVAVVFLLSAKIAFAFGNISWHARTLSSILTVLTILLFGYLLSGALTLLIAHKIKQSQKTSLINASTMINLLVRIVVFSLAVMMALDSLGISITPILASLGVGSLAIALALQDTLANFFSGIYLLIDRPLVVGDFVQLESGDQGHVVKIGWRSTHIRMLQNNDVVIPNSKLGSSQFVNFTSPMSDLAVLVNLGVHYKSDLVKVEKVTVEVAKMIMQTVEGAVKTFEPFIRYNNFGDSSIDFTVILRGQTFVDQYLITHEFIKALHQRYKKEGIEIPFPIRTLDTSKPLTVTWSQMETDPKAQGKSKLGMHGRSELSS